MESAFLSRSSSTDPLSNVLSLLRPRGYMSGGVDAGGDWAFAFAQDEIFRCFALVSGQCWLSMEGVTDALRLEAGDFVVLPHGLPFRLASDLTVASVDIMEVIDAPLHGKIVSWGGGGSCLALSALFTFAGDHTRILLEVLPPIVHIRNESDRLAMRWYLERMMKVLRDPQPGAVLVGEHLAQMMLIEILRLHIEDKAAAGVGWLFALTDKQVSAAITAMHKNPGRRWTLQGLAEHAGMSRSSFALRFKEKTGTSAMGYLTQWRMLLASDRLLHSTDSVSVIALSLGYESESAFGFAFRREMGCSPRQYARSRMHVPVKDAAAA
jgi:AraC-like DNA-binding protein